MRLIFGSVCSGIEAASVAWNPLGWRCAFMSDIDKFPRAVLAHHYPEVPLHGDFTTIKAGQYDPIDVLVGGTPCQDFSVAGLRKGITGERGNLTLEFVRLAERLQPQWIVWENVPGVLSLDEGRAFGAFLGGLAELGYGFAYCVRDAQFFNLAQRRERVFVVGYLGDWRRAAAVLFERESLSGNPPPRREKGQGFAAATAPSLTASGREVERAGESRGQDPVVAVTGTLNANGKAAGSATSQDAHAGFLIPILEAGARTGKSTDDLRAGSGIGDDGDPMFTMQAGKQHAVAYGGNNTAGPIDIATACNAHNGRQDFESETFIAHTLKGEGFDASEDGTGRGVPLGPTARAIAFSSKDNGRDAAEELSPTLRAMGHSGSHANAGGQLAVAFNPQASGKQTSLGYTPGADTTGTLECNQIPAVAFGENVRGELRTVDIASAVSGGGGKPGQGYQAAMQGSAVRRLTPRECERLQGFPEIENTLSVVVCRSEEEKHARAQSAASNLAAPGRDRSVPVAVNVRIDLERQRLQLLSLGRSPWYASVAEMASSSRPPILSADFAQLLALINTIVAQGTHIGEAESPQNGQPSSPHLNGSAHVLLSGHEIAERVRDAGQFTSDLRQCLKSTTSAVGPNSPTLGSTLTILGCFVSGVINGFIPGAMRGACSYELRLTTHHGYTAITYRGKPAADGPRYKALGNSMAVPVMSWIGERIELVERLVAESEAA